MEQVAITHYTKWITVHLDRDRHTFEVRVLPSTLDAEPVLEAAALFEALLDWCCQPATARLPLAATLVEQIALLSPSACNREKWLDLISRAIESGPENPDIEPICLRDQSVRGNRR